MAFLFRAEDATHSSVASLVVFKLWRTLNHKPFQFIRSEAKPAKPQSPECQIATPRKVVESPSPELLNPPRSQQGKLPRIVQARPAGALEPAAAHTRGQLRPGGGSPDDKKGWKNPKTLYREVRRFVESHTGGSGVAAINTKASGIGGLELTVASPAQPNLPLFRHGAQHSYPHPGPFVGVDHRMDGFHQNFTRRTPQVRNFKPQNHPKPISKPLNPWSTYSNPCKPCV